MDEVKKGYEKLGPNIRALRKTYGESPLDLSLEIGVGVTAISQYENGKRIPKEEILLKIAKHFRVTETALIHDDFSESDIFEKISINNEDFTRNTFKLLYPRFSNDEALQNYHFKTARHIQKRVYEAIVSGEEFDQKDMEQFIALYQKSLEEGVLLSAANLLSFFMLAGGGISYLNPRLMEKMLSLKGKETLSKEIADGLLYSEDDEEGEDALELKHEKSDFLKEYTPLIQKCIAALKRNEKYASLGDYYLALRYIYGLAHNGNDAERYNEIGSEMMLAFKNLGNPYAKRYLNYFKEIFEK